MQAVNVLLDVNACLRYLLNDVPEQADCVAAFIEEGAEVTLEVLAECVHVLDGVYSVGKPEISKTLIAFLDEVVCVRSAIAVAALEFYAKRNLDFVDCVLLAEAHFNNRIIVTFDKKIKKEMSKC